MKSASKRWLDVLCSGLALVVLSPLVAAVALCIRLESPGRVFFVQRRVGKDLEVFRLVKFRTMVDRDPDAIDQIAEPVVAGDNDPRITRAGRFLRKTSLDELPQLWNILRGEMSLVGPRPVLPEQVEAVPEEHMVRFSVRPGLTGLAQVRGRRSLGWTDQMKADAEYATGHGFLRDIAIMLRTVIVVLGRRGVYAGERENWRAYRDKRLRQAAGLDLPGERR
jgi:lipopolysaccharide/colanic/teichoic acid biosynthesis glycosyltransferase